MVGWLRGLGSGLQNRLHRFESGSDLHQKEVFRFMFWGASFLFVFILKKDVTLSVLVLKAIGLDDLMNNSLCSLF